MSKENQKSTDEKIKKFYKKLKKSEDEIHIVKRKEIKFGVWG